MPKIIKPTRMPPIDAVKIEELIAAITDGLSLTSAAQFTEIPLPTLEGWVRKYPALKMAVGKATADHEHRMLALAEAHAARDGKLAIAILERRHSQWNKTERQEIKQTAAGTVSPELLKALASAPEKRKTTGDGVPQVGR